MPGPEIVPVNEGENPDSPTPKTTGNPGGMGTTASATGAANLAATGSVSGAKTSSAEVPGGEGIGSENIPADDPNAPKGTAAVEEAPKASGGAAPVDAAADDVQDDAAVVPGAGNAADANSARRANPYGNVMPMRMQVLVQRLVVEHREAKNSRDQALEEERGKIKHTKRVSRNQTADDIAFYSGLLGTTGVVTAALGPTVLENLGDSDMKKKAMRAQSSDMKRENLTEGEKSFQDAFNWIGLAGNAIGAISSGIKTGSSIYRARTDKNKHKRRTARFRALSGAFSMGGSIAAGFGNAENLGLIDGWGMERGSDARKRGGIADIISGIGGMGDKVFDFLGNLQEAHGYSSASGAIGEYLKGVKRKGSTADTRPEEEEDNGDISDNPSGNAKAAPKETGLDAWRKRKTAKAQRYAMEQAKKFNDTRSKSSSFKGAIGAFGGIAGGLGSILTGISKGGGGLSNEFGAIGSMLSMIGGGAKALGAVVDKGINKSEENRLHQSKEEVITDYLDGKIERIKEEADQVSLSDLEKQAIRANKLSLTDNEARTIAIMRLGVAIPEDTSDLSALKHKSELFQKITEKRAKNILMSEPAEKKAMLTALGLDEDAALEDVVKALSAGWDPSVGLVDKATVPIKQKGKSLKNKISGFFRRH